MTIPSQPRSKNYPAGGSMQGHVGSTTIINDGGGADIEALKDEFLSKKSDDTAKGIINFLQGIRVKNDLINKILKEASEGELTDEAVMTAARINREIEDALKELDKKYLRKDQEDETNFLVTFFKGLKMGKYTTGLLGTGGAVLIDENGNSHAEFDFLNIRKKALFTEITVQELKHIGGALIVSPASMIISSMEETADGYKCYFNRKNSDGKTIYNEFEVGDQGRCQTFNLEKQENGQVGNRYWWRLVTAIGDDYVVFSKTDSDTGSDIPKEGDQVSQLGNRNDPTRQNAQIYSAYGSDAPSRKMYQGINSYSLVDKVIKDEYFDVVTGRFKERTYGDAYIGDHEGKNYFQYDTEKGVEVKGKVQVEQGSTGAGNFTDLPDEVYKAVQIGGENLLLNTSFTGDYQTVELKASTSLSPITEMYSPQLKGWSGTATLVTEDSFPAGYAVERCDLSQIVKLINGETYVCGYWAKGGSYVEITLGGETIRQAVTTDKQFYSAKIQYSGSGAFRIKSDARVYMIKLERGTVATDWCPNVNDAPEVTSQFKSLWYIQQALQASTKILGGLILSSMIQLGEWENGIMQRVTAGISGIWNDDSDVSFWSGGTYEQAIATVNIIISGKTPTDADWKNLAKFVVTHGGDLIIRGYVYALGGVFRGTVYAENGEFNGLVRTAKDGKRIEIDPETQTIRMFTAQGKEAVTLYFANDGDEWDYGYGIFRKYINGQLIMHAAITPGGLQVKDFADNTQANYSSVESTFRHNNDIILRLGQVRNYTSTTAYNMIARITSSAWPTFDTASTNGIYKDDNGFLKIKN